MPAATTPKRLTGMVAVSKDSKAKPLGYITWFSVPDQDIPLRQLRKAWGMAGLESKVLPKDNRAVNTFKRAVREQEGRFTNEQDGTITETDVRLVLDEGGDVVYQVSRVVRDLTERVVDYPKALRVWFNKDSEEMHFKPLGEIPRREVLPIMEGIQADYDRFGKTVTGAKVRTLVRNYIKNDYDEQSDLIGLSGENMRGKAGGVYFVLARFSEQLESLAEMLHQLYKPVGRAYLYAVPMADSKTEREIIRSRHVANTIAEMEDAMGDVADLLRGDRERAVRENVVKHHWSKLERFKRRAAQYAEALNEEQDDLDAHVQALHRQLRKLTDI